jgi:hypothetical protein
MKTPAAWGVEVLIDYTAARVRDLEPPGEGGAP